MATLAAAKKGETVMLCVFSGMKIGPKVVTAATKSTLTIHHNSKGDMTFDRKTGKLIKPLPDNPKFASYIMDDDGTFVKPTRKGCKNKTKPRKGYPDEDEVTKAEPDNSWEDEDEDFGDYEEV